MHKGTDTGKVGGKAGREKKTHKEIKINTRLLNPGLL
jgi:hypothetical protein